MSDAEDYDRTLPEIDVSIGDLSTLSGQAWNALIGANNPPRLFRRGKCVRLELDDYGAPVIRELILDRLRYEAARSARWFKNVGNGGRVKAKPPKEVIADMLATPNPPLPVLARIVETPVFAADETLVTRPGYHPGSGLYLAPYSDNSTFEFLAHPTAVDLQNAADLIRELLTDFPFVSEADRAHAVALLVAVFARDLIQGPTPNHVVEAPCPGSGKGLLAEVVLLPAVGRHLGMIPQTRDDEELRKRLTARLREGQTVSVLDNLTRPLESAALATALTAERWEDRLLGRSETLALPIRTIWVTTANNPVLSMELARRSVRIRLDPKLDRPWLRNGFRHPDLREWAVSHRADLIKAAIVLVQAWLKAGRPVPQAPPLGSFESWSRVIGGIVEYAGFKDFLGNVLAFYETADGEGVAWRAFIEEWWTAHSDNPVCTKDLFPIAETIDGLPLGKSATERGQRTALGQLLRKSRDRVVGGCRIESAGSASNAQLWRLRRCDSSSNIAGSNAPEVDVDEVAHGVH